MRSVVGAPGDAEVEALVAGADVVVESFLPSEFDVAAVAATRTPDSSCARSRPTAAPVRTPSVRPPSSSCRPSRAALVGRGVGPQRAVPGRRPHQRVVGGHVLGHGRRRGRASRASGPGRGEHIDFSIAEVMTIAGEQLRRLHARRLAGSPPIVGAPAHVETPSVEPTLDGYVGFCTNSRQQFHSFLLLIERPDLIDDDPWGNQCERQTSMGRVERDRARLDHAAHDRGDRATGQRAAHPRRRRCTTARTSSTASTSSPAACSSTTPTTSFKMPRRPWRIDDERPAAAPRRAAPRRAHRHASKPHAPAPQPRRSPVPTAAARRECGCSTSPHGGRARSRHGRARRARRRRDPRRVDQPHRRHARHRRGHGDGRRRGGSAARTTSCSNTNKRDLTLDLGTDEGLALLRRLIGESDAVVENFSPRVLGNFGLDWEQIHAINPRCLLVRMPAFGLSGPWRDNVGLRADDGTGHGHGVDHRPPRRPAAHPAGPERSQRGDARRVRAHRRSRRARAHRARQPARGRRWSRARSTPPCELVLEATAYGNLLERDGNRSPHVAPQGLYRGREDRDVARDLGRRPTSSGTALVDALGTPAWATAPDLATNAGRRAAPRRARRAPRRVGGDAGRRRGRGAARRARRARRRRT